MREQVAEIRSQQNAASIVGTSNQEKTSPIGTDVLCVSLFLTMLILIGFFVLAGSGSKTTEYLHAHLCSIRL